jgi:hypothetical protein
MRRCAGATIPDICKHLGWMRTPQASEAAYAARAKWREAKRSAGD